jgi:hypothetical protein
MMYWSKAYLIHGLTIRPMANATKLDIQSPALFWIPCCLNGDQRSTGPKAVTDIPLPKQKRGGGSEKYVVGREKKK